MPAAAAASAPGIVQAVAVLTRTASTPRVSDQAASSSTRPMWEAEVVVGSEAGDVDRDAERFDVGPQRPVDRADQGEARGLGPDQLAQEVQQVELGASEGELVGDRQHVEPAAGRRRRGPRRRGRQLAGLLGAGADRDPHRLQRVPLAGDAGGDDDEVVLALAATPLAQLGVEFETGGGAGAFPDFGDVEPGGTDPRQAERMVTEEDLDPRRRRPREEEPAADRDRAALDPIAGLRLVESARAARSASDPRAPRRRRPRGSNRAATAPASLAAASAGR